MRNQSNNTATAQRYKRTHLSKTQNGFSLLELLISMAITVIAIVAAVGLMTKFARSAGAFTEVSTLEEIKGTSETILRADLDGAGHNLTRPSPSLAGTIFASPTAFENYTWSNGTITKTGPTGWGTPANITHALASGLGSFSFTPPAEAATATMFGANGASLGIIIGTGNPAPLSVLANGADVSANNNVPPHLPGDTYTFKIENGPSQRITKLYRTRANASAPIWTSSATIPPYPISFQVNIFNQGQSFTNTKITGAPLIALSGNYTEFAPLPNDNNVQPTAPVATTGGGSGIVILSGDRTTDSTTTLAALNENSTDILARAPKRGSFNQGDYALVIDWGSLDPNTPGGTASSLCRIVSVSTSGDNVTLSIERVRQNNAAWSRLWSTDNNHAHSFAPGATLTKLQAPVSYALSTDSRLVRVEADRVSTVAFNVRRATFNRYVEFNSPAMMFLVNIILAAEGVETTAATATETRATIEFRSTPRALNLASNQLN